MRTLVLNADYTPINISDAKKAFVDVYQDKKIMVLEHEGEYFHTVDRKYPIPSIVRLKSYRKHRYRRVPLTRKNIYKRDRYTCQYTGEQLSNGKQITIDHVIPKSKGGKHTWDNVVTCHIDVNAEKADYVLGEDKEIEHFKIPNPRRPHPLALMRLSKGKIPEEWKPYLFM